MQHHYLVVITWLGIWNVQNSAQTKYWPILHTKGKTHSRMKIIFKYQSTIPAHEFKKKLTHIISDETATQMTLPWKVVQFRQKKKILTTWLKGWMILVIWNNDCNSTCKHVNKNGTGRAEKKGNGTKKEKWAFLFFDFDVVVFSFSGFASYSLKCHLNDNPLTSNLCIYTSFFVCVSTVNI